MELSQDAEFNKSYSKYKMIVKQWEKSFFKTHRRIPSRHDIKEADYNVRKAYKYYFNLKSAVLETSLMDVPLDDDDDDFEPLPAYPEDSVENSADVPALILPSDAQIGEMMKANSSKIKADDIPKSPLRRSGRTPKKTGLKVSDEFFKSLSFNKRNPRKSLLGRKSLTQNDTSLSETSKLSLSNSEPIPCSLPILNDDDSEKPVKYNLDLSVLEDKSVNPIRLNSSNIQHNLRKVDIGWLNRCSDKKLSNDSGFFSFENTENKSEATEPAEKCFGMKNLHVAPIAPDVSQPDVVENSESETESVLNKSTRFKKIKPVVKKMKLEIIQEVKTNENVTSGNRNLRQRRQTSFKTKLGTDSDTDVDNNPKKTPVKKLKAVVAKTRSKLKKNLKEPDSEDEQPTLQDLINPYDSIDISMPRYAIKATILETDNLTDGLAAAIEIPKQTSRKMRSSAISRDSDQVDKLQKKVESGRLNENFVKINLEKKVYARGKKTMTFSKMQKQKWKSRKKMLHNTPEFPEGGVLKCFKCNETGHMSRYCKAHKGGNLLPLGENVDDASYQTLQEAESKLLEKPKVKEIFNFEAIANDNNIPLKGVHPIPQTFLKLLETTTTTVELSQKENINPLYSLTGNDKIVDIPSEVTDALKLFGHSSFREGQEIAIMRILSGMSTLVTLSTGSGKSLCYQLPAYLYAQHYNCVTIVVSPLVSLMEDQVTSMPDFLHAACLHTNQTLPQREKIINLIKDGQIHILLVSPEAIVSGEKSTGFGSILKQLPGIAFACIDEVHCVSQWSHNFRPSYLMVCRVLREKLGIKCILGLTATATRPAMANIMQYLNVPDGIEGVVTNLPLPDNLILTVSEDSQRDMKLLVLLESERFVGCNSVIVYCIRRDECERVASLIRSSTKDNGPRRETTSKKRKRLSWIVEAYHAGMSASKRKQVQQAFMSGELRIVVATVAFGMGINKSDIRGIIHYNMPGSFESYVQEVGRAGRDSLVAHCHAFIDHEAKDKSELLKHIHSNSIERHTIRKLLQKVFIPCCCEKAYEDAGNSNQKCQGHEVAFAVDETVTELDVPSENISTLLCYLELHEKTYIKVLSNVYIMCKISSYAGCEALIEAAEKCPPLAMAIALLKKNGTIINTNVIEFSVIDVASAIGWESGVVKYHLKNLEWTKVNNLPKKSVLRVEFNTLGFRVRSPGDLKPEELDSALDALYERAQLQEKTMLQQLEEVSQAFKSVSYRSVAECSNLETIDSCKDSSNKLRTTVRAYFARPKILRDDFVFEKRTVNKDQVVNDVRALISCYKDCTFTGRAIARIFQGITSPNFPAIVWGRCRFWRSYLSADFYQLVEIAKQQILLYK